MTELEPETVRDLIDGSLSWQRLQNDVLPDPKDENRFEVTRQVLQERVDWDEPILVPINDHLYVVGTDEGRKIKAECGHVFCDLEDNWREHAGVRVRESKEEFASLYTDWQSPDEDWTFQLREFLCPECAQLLAVDSVPRGYPVIKKFEPDIDTFYEEWLGRPAPDER